MVTTVILMPVESQTGWHPRYWWCKCQSCIKIFVSIARTNVQRKARDHSIVVAAKAKQHFKDVSISRIYNYKTVFCKENAFLLCFGFYRVRYSTFNDIYFTSLNSFSGLMTSVLSENKLQKSLNQHFVFHKCCKRINNNFI